ncbi:aminotransferase V [candidate division KSB1 bacterium]|nr:MAG: aminotransferase V [candidate division KSB1 bacterium]
MQFTREARRRAMYNRRSFLGAIGRSACAAFALPTLQPQRFTRALEAFAADPRTPEEIAQDESMWFEVQQAFTVDRSLVNLNNGGVSPAPAIVQAAMKRHLDYSNNAPVYTMWQILEPEREGVRQRLARTFGCDAEEIALTRNASESLQICQLGFDLQPGDEVLTTTQDYPRMITMFQQRERRDRIKLKQFSLPVPCEDDNEIVARFEKNISSKTRLILMSHMINITGQILPVKQVVQMARARNIPVIVDGAHAFAHFDFSLADLECDYYATSLHKWLFAPHGTGMLFVRQEKIKGLWPGIGAKRKEARLIYLRDRWAGRLKQLERFHLNTSLKPGFACGLATVQLKDADPFALTHYLWDKHRIIVTPIKHPEFEGIRVTPSVYTTLEEIDRFADAMEEVSKSGLPKT